MNWPPPFSGHTWPAKDDILIGYDQPVCFIAHDEAGTPHLCALTENEDTRSTLSVLPISAQQAEQLRGELITHASCWVNAEGPLWIIRKDRAARTVSIERAHKNDVPQWWPTDSENDLEVQNRQALITQPRTRQNDW